MEKKQKVLVVVGPTSSGKSALAVELARRFNGEVISADSRQVYRGLNIGTGKITKREMQGVRHHLLDVANPRRNFTAHDFLTYGRRAVTDIARCRKLPIIAGGTGFYIDALIGRITLPNVPVNQKLRTRLEKKTSSELFALLQKRDPRRAKTIDPHNKRRLIRAIEISSAIGSVPKSTESSLYNVLWLGISLPRKTLEHAIQKRLKVRIKQGMIAEATRLHAKRVSFKRMHEFGLEYRALARLLQNKISRTGFEEELFRDIRQYGKRQETYWRRNKDIVWFRPSEKKRIISKVETWNT